MYSRSGNGVCNTVFSSSGVDQGRACAGALARIACPCCVRVCMRVARPGTSLACVLCAAVCSGACLSSGACLCAVCRCVRCVQLSIQVRVHLLCCVQVRACVLCVGACAAVWCVLSVGACAAVCACVYVQVHMQLCVHVRACAAVQTLVRASARSALTYACACVQCVSCMRARSIMERTTTRIREGSHHAHCSHPSTHAVFPPTQENAGLHPCRLVYEGNPPHPRLSRVSHSSRDPRHICCIRFSH